MPNGYTFALENQSAVQVQGSAVLLYGVNGVPFSYEAGLAASAVSLYNQIKTIMTTPANFTAITTGLVWTSITPNTVTAAANLPAFTIIGSGFDGSGINSLKFNGSGFTYVLASQFTIVSDTEIDIYADIVDTLSAATWTLYYSNDGGVTWTATALTVVAS